MFQIPDQMTLFDDNCPRFHPIMNGRLRDDILLTRHQVDRLRELYPHIGLDFVAIEELDEVSASIDAEIDARREAELDATYQVAAAARIPAFELAMET